MTAAKPSREAMKAAYELNEDLFVLQTGSATADVIEPAIARALDAFAAAAVAAERDACVALAVEVAVRAEGWRLDDVEQYADYLARAIRARGGKQ